MREKDKAVKLDIKTLNCTVKLQSRSRKMTKDHKDEQQKPIPLSGTH